jgi:mRNA interferase MazF
VVTSPRRGDVWWAEAPEVGRRPVLVITRDRAIDVLRNVVVAPVTRTVRSIPSEVRLGAAEGLAVECVASFDNLRTVPKSLLSERAGRLDPNRVHEICLALDAAFDC